jgi:dTDP-glucose pyrophosphorylase/predicted transcriptional regulator
MEKIPKELFISAEQTIHDALVAINSNPKFKIAIVLDENEDFIGVVSDGDIRRALLVNKSLDTVVTKIMNSTPTTATIEATRKDLIQIMEKKGIEAIPIVNQEKLIGLESYHEVSKLKSYDNPVFIMAGGFGTRLRPLTDNCPKPMLKVGGKPMLEILIDSFIKSGFNNFYISTHYLPEKIRDYFGDGSNKGVNITYVHEQSPLGTGGALGLLPEKMAKLPLVLINGDILTKVDFGKLIEFHDKNKAESTMCVREYEYQVPFGVVEGEGNNVTSMIEKPIQRFFINAGIYILNSSVIDTVKPHNYLDMPTLLEQQIAKSQTVVKFPIYEYWLDIGRMDDFNRAQRDYSSLGF